MHPAFARIDHRPWPLPKADWKWRHVGLDLLLAHWPVPAAAVRGLVPASLAIDTFEGTAWAGVVAFQMTGVRCRPFPVLPGISAWPQLNLQLYVERDGRPGLWFLSLDASHPLAVWAANRWFHLPCHGANMSVFSKSDRFVFHSQRASAPPVSFEAEYGPTSDRYEAEPGTLEHWLTERYCLYAQDPDGCLYRGDIHHAPWPLQNAEATLARNELAHSLGFELDGPPTRLHYVKRLETFFWPLERVAEPCRKSKRLSPQVRPAFGGT